MNAGSFAPTPTSRSSLANNYVTGFRTCRADWGVVLIRIECFRAGEVVSRERWLSRRGVGSLGHGKWNASYQISVSVLQFGRCPDPLLNFGTSPFATVIGSRDTTSPAALQVLTRVKLVSCEATTITSVLRPQQPSEAHAQGVEFDEALRIALIIGAGVVLERGDARIEEALIRLSAYYDDIALVEFEAHLTADACLRFIDHPLATVGVQATTSNRCRSNLHTAA